MILEQGSTAANVEEGRKNTRTTNTGAAGVGTLGPAELLTELREIAAPTSSVEAPLRRSCLNGFQWAGCNATRFRIIAPSKPGEPANTLAHLSVFCQIVNGQKWRQLRRAGARSGSASPNVGAAAILGQRSAASCQRDWRKAPRMNRNPGPGGRMRSRSSGWPPQQCNLKLEMPVGADRLARNRRVNMGGWAHSPITEYLGGVGLDSLPNQALLPASGIEPGL